MKKRVVSAFLMILIFALCIIISSKIFAILMLICGNLCLKELIDIKYKNKYIDFVKFVCYLSISILILNGVFFKFNTLFTLIFPILSIITPIIFYNDNKKYNMEDKIMEFDTSSATVALASDAIGCTPDEIAKSLAFLRRI